MNKRRTKRLQAFARRLGVSATLISEHWAKLDIQDHSVEYEVGQALQALYIAERNVERLIEES